MRIWVDLALLTVSALLAGLPAALQAQEDDPGLDTTAAASQEQSDAAAKIMQLQQQLEAAPDNAALWYELAAQHYLGDNNAETLQCAQRAIQLDAGQADYYWLAACALDQLERHTEALEYCRRGLAVNPASAECWALMANIHNSAQEYEQAREAATQGLAVQPQDGELYYELGKALDSLKRDAEALAAYQNCVRYRPEGGSAYYHIGRIYFRQPDYTAALPAFEEAVEQAPQIAIYRYYLAETLYELDRLDEAIPQYIEAARILPDSARYEHACGFALYMADRFEEALPYNEQAAQLKPDNSWNWQLYGGTLCELGRYREAETALQRALALQDEPDDSLTRDLAYLYYEWDKYELALKQFSLLEELRPLQTNECNRAGLCCFKLGDLLQAEQRFLQTIEIAPDYSSGYYNLGRTLELQQRDAEALEAFWSAYEIDPEDVACVYRLSRQLSRAGQSTEALELVQETLLTSPDDVRLHSLAFGLSVADYDFIVAIQELRALRVLGTSETELQLMRSLLFLQWGVPTIAQYMLDDILREAPADPAALTLLGACKYQQGQYEEAAQLLQQAGPLLERDEGFAEQWQLYTAALAELGYWPVASDTGQADQ